MCKQKLSEFVLLSKPELLSFSSYHLFSAAGLFLSILNMAGVRKKAELLY